jgi:myosin-5
VHNLAVTLQARKSDDDVQQICDMCDKLKVSQIVKILNLYTPADEYEERVTPAFVRKIQAKLANRAMIESQEQVKACWHKPGLPFDSIYI